MKRTDILRRAAALCIVMLICVSFFGPVQTKADSTLSEGAETYSGRKIVSMVYDDSGSMNGAKNAYCNYTFQLFLSLFSENDSLSITFMSAPRKTTDFSVTNDREGAINRLRSHSATAYTPITAVETAFKKLTSTPSKNINDEYWLIVLTDGEFQNGQGEVLRNLNLNDYFEGYQNNIMPNGSTLKVLYIAIGDDISMPQAKTERELYSFRAANAEDILMMLKECGLLLSDYLRAEEMEGTIITTENNVIHISTGIPLRKIVLISKDASVISAYEPDGEQFALSEVIDAYYYDVGFGDKLEADVTYISGDDYILGEVEIILDRMITEDSVLTYVEPAMHLEIQAFDSNGNICYDIGELSVGDIIDARMCLYRDDTNEIIAPSMMASEIKQELVYENASYDVLARTDGADIMDITINNLGVLLSGRIQFGMHYSLKSSRTIYVYESKYDSPTQYCFDRTQLNVKNPDILGEIYCNSSMLDYDEISDFVIEVSNSRFPLLMDGEYHVDNNGRIELWPQFTDGSTISKYFVNWLSVWLIRVGEYTMNVRLRSIDSDVVLEDNLTIRTEFGRFWIEVLYHIYPFVLIFLILAYVLKKRFRRSDRVMYTKLVEQVDELEIPQGEWRRKAFVRRRHRYLPRTTGWCTLVPFLTNRKRVGHFRFKASGFSWSSKRSALINTTGCMLFAVRMEDDSDSIYRAEKIPASGLVKLNRKRWYKLEPFESIVIYKNETWYLIRFYRR